MRLAVLAAPVLTATLAAALVVAPALADAFFQKSSPHSVADTVERLKSAIEEGGASIVAEVDHSGIAKGAGMELRPAQAIIFGNPEMGTPLMQEAPSMALALPLRIAVYEDAEGKTVLVYQDLQQLAQENGIPDGMEEVESAIRKLEALTDKAVRSD